MTDSNVPVEQADRDAVQGFHREMIDKLMADVWSGEPSTFGDDNGHDEDSIHQAFANHRIAATAPLKARIAEMEAYRTADESGTPECAGTVGWNWIGQLAQREREAGIVHTEIVSSPVEGGGRVTRLYRGSKVIACATTFRDEMNFTVLLRWVDPAAHQALTKEPQDG